MGCEKFKNRAYCNIARLTTRRDAGAEDAPTYLLNWRGKMNGTCEVVKIVNAACEGGFCEVNKSDLKQSDVLFEDEGQEIKKGRGRTRKD